MASQAVEALIGVRGPEAHIARYEEMGTAPHTISVKKAAAATIGKKGLASKETGQFFGKTVHHPGPRRVRSSDRHWIPRPRKRWT
jgi:hypothetical protein